jgi:hypothetical protein
MGLSCAGEPDPFFAVGADFIGALLMRYLNIYTIAETG